MMHSWLYCTRAFVGSSDLNLAEVGPAAGHDKGSPHKAGGNPYRWIALWQLGLHQQKDFREEEGLAMDFWILRAQLREAGKCVTWLQNRS